MKLTIITLLTLTALSLPAGADEPAARLPVQRMILGRHDQSGVPGKEIVIGTVTLLGGDVIAYHTHPGDEAGYVIKGTFILKTRGQPDRTLQAGDSFFNVRGAVHSLVAVTGGDGGIVVANWIVDKDQPIATQVP